MDRQILIERLFDTAAEARRRGYPRVEETALKELKALGLEPARKPVEIEKRGPLEIRKAS
jgi:hypothetical protein